MGDKVSCVLQRSRRVRLKCESGAALFVVPLHDRGEQPESLDALWGRAAACDGILCVVGLVNTLYTLEIVISG